MVEDRWLAFMVENRWLAFMVGAHKAGQTQLHASAAVAQVDSHELRRAGRAMDRAKLFRIPLRKTYALPLPF